MVIYLKDMNFGRLDHPIYYLTRATIYDNSSLAVSRKKVILLFQVTLYNGTINRDC